MVLGIVQQQLPVEERDGKVDLGLYLSALGEALLAAHGRGGIRLVTAVERVRVPVRQALALGMILNELIANSVLHAFPDRRAGTVGIEVRRLGHGGAEIVIADDGIGLDPAHFPSGRDGSTGRMLVAELARRRPRSDSTARVAHGSR
jgi:two-component sensor histidine kinase